MVKILTVAVWVLCLLAVVNAAMVLFTVRAGNDYTREIDHLVWASSLMLATYVLARSVTGIIRAVGAKSPTPAAT